MNERKKIIVVIVFIVIVLLGTIGFAYAENNRIAEIYNQFEVAFNGNENTLVYIGSETCGYCGLLNPSLEDMKERYEFNYTYIDVNDLNSNYMSKIMNKLGLEKIGTPYLAVVSNGKVVDKQNGYADYDVTFEFLQKNNIINKDAKLLLNYIDYKEYEKLLKSDEKNIIVVGQSTCGYCVQAKILLNEIAEEKDVTINYLNISYLTEEEGEKFEKSLDYFSDSWGTPVMLLTKNGRLLDSVDQLVSKEKYIEFLEENEVIE